MAKKTTESADLAAIEMRIRKVSVGCLVVGEKVEASATNFTTVPSKSIIATDTKVIRNNSISINPTWNMDPSEEA